MSNARRSSKVKLEVESETVAVMLMKSLTVKATGKITGKQYIFSGAGSIINIDKEDLNGLLESNQLRQSCCGGISSPYFSLV